MIAKKINLRYSDCQVLKTPLSAVQSPRKQAAIFTSIGFAPMGGSAANTRPVRGICPPSDSGFELPPACLKSRFRLTIRSKTMSKKNRGSRKNSHFTNIERAPYELVELVRHLPSSLSKLSTSDKKTRKIADAAAKHASNANDTVLFGLEAIGKLLFIAGANNDHELESNSLADLGALITHLAVEAQSYKLTQENLRHALADTRLKVVGGKA
jgi:hypothetical protein